MPILIEKNADRTVFHLQGPTSSYVAEVLATGFLCHAYWGPRLRSGVLVDRVRLRGRAHSAAPADMPSEAHSPDVLPLECPVGNVDYRPAMVRVTTPEGASVFDPRYKGHRIEKGKVEPEGMPGFFAEGEGDVETLVVTLADEKAGLEIDLSYSIWKAFEGVVRSTRIRNTGKGSATVTRALSFSLDMLQDGLDVLTLPGAWAREREMVRQPLLSGNLAAESRRGSSSHHMHPFLALLEKGADENQGRVYAAHLAYSGSHLMMAGVDPYRTTRLMGGIQPDGFTWHLPPGAAFQTPEALLVFSDTGLGGMSLANQRLTRDRFIRGKYRTGSRPILVNNWEATYFTFDEDKLLSIADGAAPLGLDMLVLDDGWFGARNDGRAGLGDWQVNQKKLPGGLTGLSEKIKARGLQFGLWVEPEMVNPDSDLYRAHPDWAIAVPGRAPATSRNQLVLDYSRTEVQDWAIATFSRVFAEAKPGYIKWDFNRQLTDVYSPALPAPRQGEVMHRYVLGLYRVMGALVKAFPDILFEGCSGGGGRFDLGILAFMPQTWTSDNSDAVARLKIQHGTSLLYPPLAMVTHVSAVPNHQVHRTTSMTFRHHVAFFGNMGYELDPKSLTAEESAEVKTHIARYREIRHLVETGDLIRLKSPYEGVNTAWMLVRPDKGEALVGYFRTLGEANDGLEYVRLKGLDASKNYNANGIVYGGDQLMAAGLPVPSLKGDFASHLWHLTEV